MTLCGELLTGSTEPANRPAVCALSAWNIELRKNGWFIYRTPFLSDPKAEERGPYRSIGRATLTIARELAREAVKRPNKN